PPFFRPRALHPSNGPPPGTKPLTVLRFFLHPPRFYVISTPLCLSRCILTHPVLPSPALSRSPTITYSTLSRIGLGNAPLQNAITTSMTAKCLLSSNA